jgi:hypothetical protein
MKRSRTITVRYSRQILSSQHKQGNPGVISTNLSISPARYVLITVFAAALLSSCQRLDPVQEEKERTLTSDERYIVEYYMKITKIEENLQDNPDERKKKWDELKSEIDEERIRRILLELENKPERWLAIYNRINELQKRNASNPSN